MDGYINLARRYRPQTFQEVVGQEVVVQILKNGLKKNRISSAYLFCGSKGTGKTTLARILGKALNCSQRTLEQEPCNQCTSCQEIQKNSSLDVLEMDAASHRGIEDIRRINETVIYAPSSFFKIYIIDEVHMLTKEAFNALLKTLEEPPQQVKFFLATTEPHKIPPTILSRCQRLELKRISKEKISQKLKEIAQDLQRPIQEEALYRLASYAEGSLRDAELLLDQVLGYEEAEITEDTVEKALGLIPEYFLFEMDQAVAKQNLSFCFSLVDKIYQSGKDFFHLLDALIEHMRNLLFFQVNGGKAPGKYQQSLSIYTLEELLYLLQFLLQSRHKVQKIGSEKTEMEGLLLQILRVKQRLPLEAIAQKLLALEKKIPKVEPPRQETLEPPTLRQVPFSISKPSSVSSKEIKIDNATKPEKTPFPDLKQQARYETLLRFASVELEGFLKK